jgi:hypothetical protein
MSLLDKYLNEFEYSVDASERKNKNKRNESIINLIERIGLYLDEAKKPRPLCVDCDSNTAMKGSRYCESCAKSRQKALKNKKNESVDESTRINWNTVAYKYSHGKFPLTTKEHGLWMFELNGKDKLQYQGKWAEAKKYVENEVKLRVAKGIYGKSGSVDVKVMP